MRKPSLMARRRGTMHLRLLLALCLLLGLAAPAAALEKVSVQLLWVHQAQFAGIYLAQDEGLYAKAGLEVKAIPGGPAVASLGRLRDGKCDFAMAWLAAGIEERAAGTPLINLAQLVQKSGCLLVANADAGVETMADLAHRRVALWDSYFSLAPRALFAKEDIPITEVRQGISMALLLNRAVAAASAMTYNELHRLFQAGVNPQELVVMSMAELGYNFPEDGIYTLRHTWRERPDTCRRFVEATMEGWRMVLAKPDLALKAVMKRIHEAKLASNQSHQSWMIREFGKLLVPTQPGQPMGKLHEDDYEAVARRLLEDGFIDNSTSFEDFYIPAWKPAK